MWKQTTDFKGILFQSNQTLIHFFTLELSLHYYLTLCVIIILRKLSPVDKNCTNVLLHNKIKYNVPIYLNPRRKYSEAMHLGEE